MKRFVMTAALTCVLFGSSLAGEIPSVGITQPPPPPSTPTAPGEIPTSGYAQEMSEAALDIIQLVFSAVV